MAKHFLKQVAVTAETETGVQRMAVRGKPLENFRPVCQTGFACKPQLTVFCVECQIKQLLLCALIFVFILFFLLILAARLEKFWFSGFGLFLFSFHLFIQDQAVCLWMWAFCRVISARINLLSTRRSCGLSGGYDPCCCFSFSFSFSFCFLMNTHKVANEAAEWESEELSTYAYEYIQDVQGCMYVESAGSPQKRACALPYS